MFRRVSKFFLEAIGVTVAVSAVLLAVLAWRLSAGPVSLPILSQILQDAVSGELEGGTITIGDTILRWAPDSHQLGLRVVNVTINGADGNPVTTLPQLSFRLSVPALLRGHFAPTSVELYGVTTTLLRRPSGLSLGLAPANKVADHPSNIVLGPMIEALVSGSADMPVLAYLRRVGIHDATLRVVDEVNSVTFEAPNANLEFYRSDNELAATLSADLTLDDTTGHIDLKGTLPQGADVASVHMNVTGIVPAALARMSPSFHNYASVDAPISTVGDLDILRDGTVKAARLEVESGKGRFHIPGLAQAPVELEKARAELTLDALAHRIEVKDLTLQAGPHSITMKGNIVYAMGKGVNISTAALDLTAGKTTTEIEGVFEGPVTFDNAHFVGTLDFDNRAIDIKQVTLGVAGGKITASGIVGEGERSPALKATATIGQMPINEARAVWPLFLSPKSRDWVVKNLKDGDLMGGELYIDVAANVLADDEVTHTPLPDGGLRFEFNIRGSTVSYLHDMPPLENVVARGLVANNRFDAYVSSASVTVSPDHVLALSNGRFTDSELSNHHTRGQISFLATGQTADILALLDHEPLHLISKFGIDPAIIGGAATVNAQLNLPLVKEVTIDEVDFSGTAHAEDVSIPHIQPDLSITGGTLDIDVSRAGLKATGTIALNNIAPFNLVWTERFTRGNGPSSAYTLSGDIDNAGRAAIGLHFDKYLDGPVTLKAALTGSGPNINHAAIHADLTRTKVMVNYLGWTKPADAALSLDVDLSLTPDLYRFKGFKLAGEGVDVHGDFDMNKTWDWMSLDLPVVRLGPANSFAMQGRRDAKGTLSLDISGARADASGLLHSFVSGNGDKAEAEAAASRLVTPEMVADPARRSAISASIAHVTGQNGTHFSKLEAHFTLIDDWVYALKIDSLDQTQKPIMAEIAPGPERSRVFSMASSDAGSIFRTLDLANGVKGGALTVKARFDDSQPGSPMKGSIDVLKFRVSNAPVLAKILTLGSLTGISDTMQGDGIYFDHLILPFRVTGHRIHVEDARLAGPAIGLTMQGQIDRVMDVVDLEGTLVPAYTINSVLGNVPLLGPLLIGREGEGIFGMTYKVKGATDNPSVIVNPLSAIAPGFLRRLFEFGNSLPPEPTPPAINPAKPAESAPPVAPIPSTPAAPDAPALLPSK